MQFVVECCIEESNLYVGDTICEVASQRYTIIQNRTMHIAQRYTTMHTIMRFVPCCIGMHTALHYIAHAMHFAGCIALRCVALHCIGAASEGRRQVAARRRGHCIVLHCKTQVLLYCKTQVGHLYCIVFKDAGHLAPSSVGK